MLGLQHFYENEIRDSKFFNMFLLSPFTALWANSADNRFRLVISYFSLENICMKCPYILGKKKKNISKGCLL